jgi:hypothetical protein
VAAVVVIRGFHWAFHSRTKKTLAIFAAVANEHRVKSRADIAAASARVVALRMNAICRAGKGAYAPCPPQ